jgi:hypothetical protein
MKYTFIIGSMLVLGVAALATIVQAPHPVPPIGQDYTATKDASGNDTNAVAALKKGYWIQCNNAVGQNNTPAVCHIVLQPSGQTQDLRAKPSYQTMGVGDNDTMIFTCNGTAPTTCTISLYFK